MRIFDCYLKSVRDCVRTFEQAAVATTNAMLRMLLRVRNIFLDKIPPRLKTDTLLLRLKTHARIKERTQNALCRRKRRRLCRRQRQKDARVPNTLFPSWTLRAPRLKTGAVNPFLFSFGYISRTQQNRVDSKMQRRKYTLYFGTMVLFYALLKRTHRNYEILHAT